MRINRRKFLVSSAVLGAAGGLGIGAWEMSKLDTKARIVISGGGAAGIGVANRLQHLLSGAQITIVDPRDFHWYQPGQTLLLAGTYKTEADVKSDNEHFVPSDVRWVKDSVSEYDPDNNRVITAGGESLAYDYLIVATGLELRYDWIEGLDTAAIGQGGVTSIYYSPEAGVASHKQALAFAKSGGGKALFTRPQGAMKCAGAPMKATNLVEYFARQAGQREDFDFQYMTSENFLFSVTDFNDRLTGIWADRGINANFQHTLKTVDLSAKTATFQTQNGDQSYDWDFIHIAPPMSPVASLRDSALADQDKYPGYLEVDKYTLQHNRYSNVFGLGDTVGTPIGKTAASVKSQIPVVAENIRSVIEGKALEGKWGGYTSCPMILDVGHAMLWEFDYGMKPMTGLPFEVVDPLKISELAWVMEKSLIRPVYNVMLHGFTPV